MATNIKKVQEVWEHYGKEDPLWSILTWEGTEKNKWNIKEFFKYGQKEIDGLMKYLNSLGRELPKGRALDFGCGAGRLARGLSKYYKEVRGVDISAPMIKLANEHKARGENIKYHVNTRPDLKLFSDGFFDLIYTNIVLQHNPPKYARAYIKEFIRLLSPNGALVFQMPSETIEKSKGIRKVIKTVLPARANEAIEARKHAVKGQDFEMHSIRKAEVEKLVRRAGAKIIDVEQNEAGGPGWISYRYTVVKR